MTEKFPILESSDLEKKEKDPLELKIEEAKILHGNGDPEGAMDILEDALNQAYREKKMDIYDDIVDLMDEWES